MTTVKNKKSVLVPVGQQGGRRALMCIPHAGAGASAFFPWASKLGEETALLAARLPGRERLISEEPLDNVTSIVARLAAELAAVDVAELTILGHCSGAVIAYELAHELLASGDQRVVRLIVSSQRAPGSGPAEAPWPGFSSRPEIVAYLRETGGTDDVLLTNEKFVDLMGRVVNADLRAMSGYRKPPGREPLPVPVVALGGRSDTALSERDLMSWSAETTGEFGAYRFDGDHFFLLEPSDELIAFVTRNLGS
jgi:medium-chain acyl-[acyl-carrier-protein] hydrolase